MAHDIQQKEIAGAGLIFIDEDGERLAELSYTRKDNGILNLDHTETNPKMTGKGLGSKLIKHAVDFARENDLKIDPICGYAAKMFERHEEYRDIQVSSD